MSEGLEVWIPNDVTPSLRNLETQPVRPLMDVVLPRIYPNLDLEWQSGEWRLIAPEGARREIAAAES